MGLAVVLGLAGCGTAAGDRNDQWEPNATASASRNDAVAELVGRWNYLADFQVDAATLVVNADGSATYVAGDDPTDYVGKVKPLKQQSGQKEPRYEAELTGRGKTVTLTLRADPDGRALHVTDESGDTRVFARGV
ncbi:MAG: hypothetical protein GEU94_16675 [Micromonosporaceae bacterium]|nr:hypothetical protein [Micromonosporaceae bacterium]